MQLLHLKLVNFRQHADTDITLGPGLTAIIGPNGVGKTTLLEAITWAFYGTSAVRGTRDSIRFNRAPARSTVRVEVTFALGAHEYRVTRGLNQAELFQDGQPTAIANSQQEVTARVGRLLGMTRDEFFNTYFTGQKELAVMAAMGPADRARFLSQVLGYEKLKLAQDKLRERRSVLKGELAGLQAGMAEPQVLEAERVEAERRLKDARDAERKAADAGRKADAALKREGPAWTKMTELRERVLALDGDRRVAEQTVTEARSEFQRLDKEMAAALEAKAELTKLEKELAPAAALRHELERLDQEAKAAGQRRTLTGQLDETRAEGERAGARLAAMGDVAGAVAAADTALQARRAELKAAEESEQALRTGWVREQQEAQTKLQAHRDQHKDLKDHLDGVISAGRDGVCPTCGRALGDEYDAVIADLKRQLDEVTINGKYFRQRVEQLGKEPAELVAAAKTLAAATKARDKAADEAARRKAVVREHAELTTEVGRITARVAELERTIAALPDAYDVARHDEVRDRLKELEPAIRRAAQLLVVAEHAERLVKEAEAAERVLSERETRAKQLALAIADLGFSEEKFTEARERYEAAERARHDAEVQLATVSGDVRTAEAQLATSVKRIAEREERAQRLKALTMDHRLHDVLDQALADLRAELNAQLRPELSEIASAFLADLTDGRYHELELNDEYRIIVLEDGVAKPVISGGEEDVANLVLRIAISQMVADRAGQPLSLLVLDEIFGSLDEGRRRHVLELLRRLGDRFPQVVLITHIESVRESVDRVLRVELDAARGAAVVREDPGAISDEDVAA